jgi:hypothetical protein
MWKENINNNYKYVFLAPGSSLKGQSDMGKFEKARNLKVRLLFLLFSGLVTFCRRLNFRSLYLATPSLPPSRNTSSPSEKTIWKSSTPKSPPPVNERPPCTSSTDSLSELETKRARTRPTPSVAVRFESSTSGSSRRTG